MCLVTEQQKPIKIKEDIIVYKVLIRRALTEDLFFSGYYGFEYKTGVLYTQEMVYNDIPYQYYDDLVYDAYPNWKDLNFGFMHVHDGFHSALYKSRLLKDANYKDGCLVECVIPKGSLIFKDKTGLVASDRIMIKEVVQE